MLRVTFNTSVACSFGHTSHIWQIYDDGKWLIAPVFITIGLFMTLGSPVYKRWKFFFAGVLEVHILIAIFVANVFAWESEGYTSSVASLMFIANFFIGLIFGFLLVFPRALRIAACCTGALAGFTVGLVV